MLSSKIPPEYKTMNTVVVKWGMMNDFIGGVHFSKLPTAITRGDVMLPDWLVEMWLQGISFSNTTIVLFHTSISATQKWLHRPPFFL
jgi:hypothetical protein